MNTWVKALMAAGMLAGLAKPVKEARENNLGLPSFAGALEVKSAIPGRIRFYMPKLKGDAEFAAALAGALSGINVINRSNINSTTGSLLVVYDETAVEPEVLMGAVMRLAGGRSQLRTKIQVRDGNAQCRRSAEQCGYGKNAWYVGRENGAFVCVGDYGYC